MERLPRAAEGGMVCHVLNRASARMRMFDAEGGYAAFEKTRPGRKAYLEPCPARAISTMWKVVSFSPVATSARSLFRSSVP